MSLKPSKNLVPLVAAFKGVKFFPEPLAIGYNNFNPKLILNDDCIEFRCLFFMNRKKYDQIEKIDIYVSKKKTFGIGTVNVCISFKDSLFTFVGNLNNVEELKKLLKTLKAKKLNLTEKASQLMAE